MFYLRCLAICFIVLAGCSVASAANPDQLTDQLQSALLARDPNAYLALVVPEIKEQESDFINSFFANDYEKLNFKVADADEGSALIQLFMQGKTESRYDSWKISTEVRDGRKLIASRKEVSSITGLYYLHMSRQAISVRNLQFAHYDSVFHFDEGNLFPITASGQIGGFVFIGDGSLDFTPKEPTEQQQLNLFCKQTTLHAKFKSVYMRGDAAMVKQFLGDLLNSQGTVLESLYSRAQDIEKDSDSTVYGVQIPLSDAIWYPRLQKREVYIEMKSQYGTLIYQYYPGQTDDLLLAQKDKNRVISLYSSRGIYSVPQTDDFKILSYKMNVSYVPTSQYMSGTAEMLLKSEGPTSTVVFDLNPDLRVSEIRSSQGSLMYFQERKSNNLHVVLNDPIDEGDNLRLQFRYAGRIEPDKGRLESVVVQRQQQTEFYIAPSYLYSSQALWYPQLESKPYSQLEASISVPDRYIAITNGRLTKKEDGSGNDIYSYSSVIPIKYFSLFICQLNGPLKSDSLIPIEIYYHTIDRSGAESSAKAADRILRFYSSIFGNYPYQNLTLVLRPMEEPGGNAPASVAIVNRVFSYFEVKYIRDPVNITDFPDFFLAHELAHQWWGQAVGWAGYRDQWLSEGFAQYAATRYVREVYGDDGWLKLSRTYMKWIQEKTYAGPIILGTRLGHLIDDPQAFSALLYDKGAYVLNMLRVWMGDQKFNQCMIEFYHSYQFKRASIVDFMNFAQKYSDDQLAPFFEQWLYRWDIPAVMYSESHSGTSVKLHFSQVSSNFYRLKIPIVMKDRSGNVSQSLVFVDQPDKEVELTAPAQIVSVEIDPLHENLATYKQQ